MRSYLFVLMLLATGSCTVFPSDYTPVQDSVATQPKMVVAQNPVEANLKDQSARLLARIDAVDALAHDPVFEEEAAFADARRDSSLGAWATAARSYRATAASFERDTAANDSTRMGWIAELDSLSGLVTHAELSLLELVRVAEIRNIEEKLSPAASFRFQGAPYSAIRVNPAAMDIHLHWKNATGEKYISIQKLKQDLEKKGETVMMITNAGMYNPDNSPQGLFIDKGKQLVPMDTSRGPAGQTLNFFLMPNGVFYIGNDGPKVVVTEKFPKFTKGIKFATQSGPMLVIDGKLHPKFTKGSNNTNIRSGVGITRDKQVVFAISDRPVNFHDFAMLFKDALHCDNALYLDGAISQMYLPTTRRMDLGGDFGPIVAVTVKN
jgi:uncharacterized protein YigE (DUF2233 family)